MSRQDIVKTLLECGADVNFGNSANRTSAMIACLVGNLEVTSQGSGDALW